MAVLRPFLVFFFANCMDIFHKTGLQVVILRLLTCLNPNCFKSYAINCKRAKNAENAKKDNTQMIFLQYHEKLEMELFVS